MTDGRPARIWSLVAAQAARHGGRVSAADACVAAVAAVDVTGAWLMAANGEQGGHLMRVTDKASEVLAELQLTLGEGPGPDATASGGPVLASDLDEMEAVRRWPAFAPAARQAGAAAIFAFPLQFGAIRTGVMSLYRVRSGPLSAFQLGDALIFPDTAPRSIRLPGCSPNNSVSASRRPLSACAPTRMLMIGDCLIWPVTSWHGACGWSLTPTHARTARRDSAQTNWPAWPFAERVSGDGRRAAV